MWGVGGCRLQASLSGARAARAVRIDYLAAGQGAVRRSGCVAATPTPSASPAHCQRQAWPMLNPIQIEIPVRIRRPERRFNPRVTDGLALHAGAVSGVPPWTRRRVPRPERTAQPSPLRPPAALGPAPRWRAVHGLGSPNRRSIPHSISGSDPSTRSTAQASCSGSLRGPCRHPDAAAPPP